jgi:hypothetical protein
VLVVVVQRVSGKLSRISRCVSRVRKSQSVGRTCNRWAPGLRKKNLTRLSLSQI